MNTIYLYGETHDNSSDRLKGIHLIKQLSVEKKIQALSLEAEFNKYQSAFDAYSPGDGLVFGRITPLVNIAKVNNLAVLASDYRDTFAGYLINWIRNQPEDGPESLSEEQIKNYLQPLTWSENSLIDGPVSTYLNGLSDVEDIFDALDKIYTEERERFTANYIDSQIKNNSFNVMHIGGKDHTKSLEKKLSDNYSVVLL
ncbi:ChaN family lipoprotein [Candidatus Woesearchaeota archaeon]|nr:ChaN family lipoprotein [Candidatus Woesearchaeota archaeon]